MNNNISYFATTNGRQPHLTFGIYQADRMQHTYVLGKTGTGKSTLLQNLFMQDISSGRGCILLDPHGDLSCAIAHATPQNQKHRLVFIDIPNAAGRYGYNPLKNVAKEHIPRAVSGLLETMRQHFGEKSWGNRMEHILRNTLYALLEYQNAALPDILRMLSEKEYRLEVLTKVTYKQVIYFWQHEYSKLWGNSLFEAIAPIQNKVGAFLTDPVLVKTLVDFDQAMSFRKAMDDGQIIVVNLARGSLGSDTSRFIGSLFTQTIALAALSRLELHSEDRKACHIYLDEFEHLMTKGTATMLSELRKANVSILLASQYVSQLEPDIKAAVLGNVGTLISFRIGPDDARLVSRIYGEGVTETDLMNLPNYDLYVKMMIDGEPSKVVSGRGLLFGSIK